MNQEEMFTILKEQGDKIYSYKLFWNFCKKLLEMFDFYESENRKEHYQVGAKVGKLGIYVGEQVKLFFDKELHDKMVDQIFEIGKDVDQIDVSSNNDEKAIKLLLSSLYPNGQKYLLLYVKKYNDELKITIDPQNNFMEVFFTNWNGTHHYTVSINGSYNDMLLSFDSDCYMSDSTILKNSTYRFKKGQLSNAICSERIKSAFTVKCRVKSSYSLEKRMIMSDLKVDFNEGTIWKDGKEYEDYYINLDDISFETLNPFEILYSNSLLERVKNDYKCKKILKKLGD